MILTYVYRDQDKAGWAKKVHVTGFIKDKDYELVKGGKGKVDHFFLGEVAHLVHLLFEPKKRQRKKEDWYNLEHLDFCGLAARGTRLSTHAVARVKIHRSRRKA